LRRKDCRVAEGCVTPRERLEPEAGFDPAPSTSRCEAVRLMLPREIDAGQVGCVVCLMLACRIGCQRRGCQRGCPERA